MKIQYKNVHLHLVFRDWNISINRTALNHFFKLNNIPLKARSLKAYNSIAINSTATGLTMFTINSNNCSENATKINDYLSAL